MNIHKILIVPALLLLGAATAFGQVTKTKDYYKVENDFLIIASKKDYREAQKIAREASQKLKVTYNTRGALLDTITGNLKYSKDTCEAIGGKNNYPCNRIRGLLGVSPEPKDNGIYITIEQTYHYTNLTKGYFAVVAGSGNPGDKDLKTYLTKVKKLYPDSYIKRVTLFYDACGE